MCNFFSFCSDGKGHYYYFDWPARQEVIKDNPHDYEPDSHTSIAHFHGFKGEAEDKLNKYEFNPITKTFQVDHLVHKKDANRAKAWVNALDFKTIVAPLIIKPFISPFNITPPKRITKTHLSLLKKWDSVGDSMRGSVRDSVWDSVGGSVGDSVRGAVWASVWDSVWDSVGASVWASVRASVWDSVWDSVWASVGASVWASVRASVVIYFSSFFDIDYQYNFSLLISLWEQGIVPSYDGKTWRLHVGPDAQVIWQGEIK